MQQLFEKHIVTDDLEISSESLVTPKKLTPALRQQTLRKNFSWRCPLSVLNALCDLENS